MADELPPDERRVIVPLDEPALHQCNASLKGRRMLADPEVMVVDLPLHDHQAEHPHGAVAGLIASGRIRNQEVLIMSPLYKDRYLSLEGAPDEVTLEKLLLTIHLCKELGASEVTITEARRRSARQTLDLQISATEPRGSGGLSAAAEDVQKEVVRTNSLHEFAGGAADIESARTLLARARCDQDLRLQGLIEFRSGANPLTQQTLSISTRSETESTRRLAAKAGLPIAEIQAGVERVVAEKVTYDFTFEVIFPKRS